MRDISSLASSAATTRLYGWLKRGDGRTKDDVVDSLSYACAMIDEYGPGHGARPFVLGTRCG